MKKRQLVGGLLTAALLISGCAKKQAPVESPKTLEKIRVGVMTDNINDYVAAIANSEGIFAKHGLEVEVASFARGINTIDAVTMDQMNIGGGADFAVLNRLGGSVASPLRIFAGVGDTLNIAKLYARDPEVNSPADLAGKSVVVQLGTVDEYYLSQTFTLSGVPLSSVNLLPIDAPMEGVVLIQNGSATAMYATGRAEEALLKIDGVRKVADLSTYVESTVNLAIATEKFLQEHQSAAIKYLQATQEVYDLINSDPQRVAEIINKVNAVPVEQVLLNIRARANYIEMDQKFFDNLSTMYTWAETRGIIKNPYNLHTYINANALKAGFPDRGNFK
jgi:NitT/TauT family transport system substrate-binding protein